MMFKRIFKFIRDKGITLETVNVLTGTIMFGGIVWYGAARTKAALYLIIICGALINFLNGFSYMRKKERKTFGMSMILLGFCVILFFSIFAAIGYI